MPCLVRPSRNSGQPLSISTCDIYLLNEMLELQKGVEVTNIANSCNPFLSRPTVPIHNVLEESHHKINSFLSSGTSERAGELHYKSALLIFRETVSN